MPDDAQEPSSFILQPHPLGKREFDGEQACGAALLTGATYISLLLGIAARKAIALLLTPEQVGVYQAALSFVDLAGRALRRFFGSLMPTINCPDNPVTEPRQNWRENIFDFTCRLGLILFIYRPCDGNFGLFLGAIEDTAAILLPRLL